MSLPTSWVTEYADHRRGSRVAVRPRRYGQLERLVPADLRPLRAGPEAVLVGEHPTRWALCFSDVTLVVDAAGTREYFGGSGRRLASLADGAVRVGNRVWSADAPEYTELRPLEQFDEAVIQTVARLHEGSWTAVTQRRQPFASNDLSVRAHGRASWAFDWPGEGTAAIADDGTVAIATIDRIVQLLQDPADPEASAPRVHARIDLPHEPYAITAIDGGFVVLSAIEDGEPEPGARIGRLHGRGAHDFESPWHTEVRRLDRDARTLWTAVLPFAALQPAIDAGDDRVVIAGRGLASIDAGVVGWSHPSADEVFASSFVDGTLAVAIAAQLLVVDRNGAAQQRIAIPHGHAAVTPPAIAADGGLALGTRVHTYVLAPLDE